MKRWIAVFLALFLSGCSAHALRHILTPKPEPLASVSRLQFNCTDGGLFIFEDFPDIVRSHPATSRPAQSAANVSDARKNSAHISKGCLSSIP